MARLLLFADHTAGEPVAPLLLLAVVVVLVVAAVVVSLCTSSTHEKLWGSSSSAPLAKADSGVGASNRKHLLSATLSGIGGKAARMVSWNRRSPSAPGGGSSDDDEEAVAALGLDDDDDVEVWRKAIIMGDKCRPLQFSGHIAFDSDGNQLPPPPSAIKEADPDVQAKN